MTQITQLAQLLRLQPKSQADWDQLIVQFNQWRTTFQGMQWQPITLQNGWTPYGGVWAPPQYYVDASGRLFCRGLITTASLPGNDVVLFTLPFAPSYRVLTTAQAYSPGAIGYLNLRVDVDTSGNVFFEDTSATALAANTWISLDQLNFSLIQ